MIEEYFHQKGNFWVLGISYQKADLALREKYCLSPTQAESLILDYRSAGGSGIVVLSTCNRTELYGFADDADQLLDLFLKHCSDDANKEEWTKLGIVKKNQAAIEHLLRVGSGLESKILGDFQIIGQLKKAFDQSKTLGATNAFLERLVNVAVEASRRVKNETDLCSGAASVSFAAVQYIKQHLPSLKDIKVLLLGTGDIGQATCSNLIKHLPGVELTLMNRSQEKALALAEKYQLETLPFSQLSQGIAKADVVVVATGASAPTVTDQHFPQELTKTLFLDLSVPRNVHQSVEEHPRCQVAHVDQLIDLTREAIERRSEEIPLAEQMLDEAAQGFYQWLKKRRFAPVLQALKAELSEIQRREIQTLAKKNPDTDPDQLEMLGARMVQKITNRFASYLHQHPGDADQDLSTIQEIFGLSKLA